MTLGILTDKAMNDAGVMIARISVDGAPDQPFEVLSYVLPFLERCEKGGQVEFTTKDRKISKIAPVKKGAAMPRGDSTEKRQAAGFDNPPESIAAETKRKEDEKGDQRIKENNQYVQDLVKQSGGTCTSPAVPAESPLTPDKRSGPQKSAGEIVAVDLSKHTFALKDAEGIITGYVWRESSEINQTMQKQKVGWYVGITYEAQGDRLVLSDIHYEDRPANMRRGNSSGGGYKGGGRSYQPRNDKIITLQCLAKAGPDVWIYCKEHGLDFKAAMNEIADAAVEAGGKINTSAGVS